MALAIMKAITSITVGIFIEYRFNNSTRSVSDKYRLPKTIWLDIAI